MRRLALLFGVGLALGLVVASSSAEAQTRPPTDLSLFLLLNGEGRRWVMPDAGASGLYGTGRQCLPVANGGVYKVTPGPAAPGVPTGIVVCHGITEYWDGGCLATWAVTELNGGTNQVTWPASHYFVADRASLPTTIPPAGLPAAWAGSNTTDKLLCSISDDGGTQFTIVERMF